MTAALERITLNKLQRPCSDLSVTYCLSAWITQEDLGRKSVPASSSYFPVVCLPVSCSCLLPLPPSPFFSLFNPGWFRLWFSPTDSPPPPTPLLVLAVPQGSTHLVSIMFAAALVSHPSLPPVSCLPFLSFLFFHPCLQLSVSRRSDSTPHRPKKCTSISLTWFVFACECVSHSVATRFEQLSKPLPLCFAPAFFLILSLPALLSKCSFSWVTLRYLSRSS